MKYRKMFGNLLAVLIGVTYCIARPDSGYQWAELSSSGNSGSETESKDLESISRVPKARDERDFLCKNNSVPYFDSLRTRYSGETKKCYFAGTTGPCPNNLIFHASSDPNDHVYGQCDCDSTNNDRTLIYHHSTQTCYFIFQQAYCPQGQWLTLDPANGQPKCESNPCSGVKRKGGAGAGRRRSTDNHEMVLVDGKCVKLDSVCGEIDGVEQFIGFAEGKLLPFCKSRRNRFVFVSFTAIKQTCAPGTLLSLSGDCQASWVW